MQEFIEQSSYIIGFKNSNAERYEALVFVLSFLRKNFPSLDIIVVEQDSKPNLELDESLQVRQTFIENKSAYNHSLGYNEGAKLTDNKILIFATADIFLSRENYLLCWDACNEFEAITPNRSQLTNIAIDDLSQHTFKVLNTSELFTFAGGVLFISRSAFERVGGWDERFEGWGGDDDAMSHVIYNTITSKTMQVPMYHIDHPRGIADGVNQIKYTDNRRLIDEIGTLYGDALFRYLKFLRRANGFEENETKTEKPKYILAVTTYNRPDYLKACISSFLDTRNQEVDWQIIIADDGSSDETQVYLDTLHHDHNAIIIRNQQTDIIRQVNSILKVLSKMEFDLCYRCDDDVLFLKKGWDDLYRNTIKRTGYDHLIFYDSHWRPYANAKRPIIRGGLISNCDPEDIQGGFYTLTKRVLQEIGYFDEQLFGRRGLGHVDFSLRCCRAGFNVLSNPFDAKDSNDFIRLQSATDYNGSVSSLYKNKINSDSEIDRKKELLTAQRKFIPYNQNYLKLDNPDTNQKQQIEKGREIKKITTSRFRRADSRFYSNRGISGFFGFVLKRIYNLGIDTHMYFIPRGIKYLGRLLNKLGLDLLHIED